MQKGPPTVPAERRNKAALGFLVFLLLVLLTAGAAVTGYSLLVDPPAQTTPESGR